MADLHHQRVLELDRRNRHHYTFRYRSLLLHWLARGLKRPAAVEPGALPPVEPGQVAVTWGGHSTALVRYSRLSVLCDPVLARSIHGVRRELASGLTVDGLAEVDLVLVSHAGPAHLDLGTLARLSRGATVVVPPGAAARVSPLGFARLVELGIGSSLDHRGVDIIAEESQHGERGTPSQSYVIRGDGPAVFFCGASGYFGGFADIGRRHLPDLALLPIGGYWPRSFRRWHMSPLDALYAFEDLRARVMVPIRYGTFALSYERVNDPERWLSELVAERHLERFVVRLGPGESRVFVPPGAAALESSRYEVDGDRAGDRVSGEPLAADPEPARRRVDRGAVSGGEPTAGAALEGAFAGELRARERWPDPDPARELMDRAAAERIAAGAGAVDRRAGERVVGDRFAIERSGRVERDTATADEETRAELPGIDPLRVPTREMALVPPPAREARARPDRSRPAAGRRPPVLRAPAVSTPDPDAFTMPGGAAGAPRSPGPPPPPRRPAAVIVDHDDETGVFDTGETRVRDADETRVRDEPRASEAPGADDDDDAAATRSLELDMPETDTAPVPVPVPGSR